MKYSLLNSDSPVIFKRVFCISASLPLIIGGVLNQAQATEPCDDFGECKVLIEINASDGDIGFHWLVDGDGQSSTRIDGPAAGGPKRRGRGISNKLWEDNTSGALREQLKTENFGESTEPLCWPDPEAEDDEVEEIVTMREFRERWAPGTHAISGKGDGGEKLSGETDLTYYLPPAPMNVDFDGEEISWEPGVDLDKCAPLVARVDDPTETVGELVADGVIADFADVVVRAYEVVMEPDVESGDQLGTFTFAVRVPPTVNAVTVPSEYLDSLGVDTPVKIEVGAIGGDFEIVEDVENEDGEFVDMVDGDDDNATFTEEDGFCVTEDGSCPE